MGLVKEKQAKMDLSNIGDPDEFAKGKPKLGAPGTWHQQDSDDDLFQPASLSVTVDGQNDCFVEKYCQQFINKK